MAIDSIPDVDPGAQPDSAGTTLQDARANAASRLENMPDSAFGEGGGDDNSGEVPVAEPVVAPTAEPAAEPAAEPVGEYPTTDEEVQEAPPGTTPVVINGDIHYLNQAQLQKLAHEGAMRLQEQVARQQAQPEAEFEDPNSIEALRAEVDSLKQQAQESQRQATIKEHAQVIETNLNTELARHQVIKDNPEIKDIAYESAMALLTANPQMSEAEAMKRVAHSYGKAFNARDQRYLRGKIQDAQSGEAGSGGSGATQGGRKLHGADLFNGNVRKAALQRLRGKELFT